MVTLNSARYGGANSDQRFLVSRHVNSTLSEINVLGVVETPVAATSILFLYDVCPCVFISFFSLSVPPSVCLSVCHIRVSKDVGLYVVRSSALSPGNDSVTIAWKYPSLRKLRHQVSLSAKYS